MASEGAASRRFVVACVGELACRPLREAGRPAGDGRTGQRLPGSGGRAGLLRPTALSNALTRPFRRKAAATKGIVSPDTGDDSALIGPNLEADKVVAKQRVCLAGADAGVMR